jgi:hypothetical protein
LKQSGLLVLFNTSQQSQTVPNEHNLTSDPSSYVVSSEYLNEQSSRPSTSVSMQTVPLQLHRWLPVHISFDKPVCGNLILGVFGIEVSAEKS